MFGARQRRELEARVAALEKRLEANEAQVDARLGELARDLEQADPEVRVRFLTSRIAADLASDLEKALADLRAGREALPALEELRKGLEQAAAGVDVPRFEGELSQVYRAEWTGYVSLYFAGGFTDSVSLLVGPEDPPTLEICKLNTSSDINSYAGGVVRRGEYWVAASRKPGRSGVKCVFTPFL